MIFTLLAALLAALPAQASTPLSVSCQLKDSAGVDMATAAKLFTGRHDQRFPVSGKLFLDLRYNALSGKVAVTVVSAPHAPWSVGEKVVEREQVLDLRGQLNDLALDPIAPGAKLFCSAS